jgi:hypothetical protein
MHSTFSSSSPCAERRLPVLSISRLLPLVFPASWYPDTIVIHLLGSSKCQRLWETWVAIWNPSRPAAPSRSSLAAVGSGRQRMTPCRIFAHVRVRLFQLSTPGFYCTHPARGSHIRSIDYSFCPRRQYNVGKCSSFRNPRPGNRHQGSMITHTRKILSGLLLQPSTTAGSHLQGK